MNFAKFSINKIKEIEALRPDIKGYKPTDKVLLLLQEAIKENLKGKANSAGMLHNGPVM